MPDVPVTAIGRFASLGVRLMREDTAQDLIEYAFLAAFVGIAGYVAVSTIGPAVNATYASWIDPTKGAAKLWDPEQSLLSAGS